MERLSNKVAIITGAGTGIGRSCYNLFAREGAKVAGVGRTRPGLEAALTDIEAMGHTGMIATADVSDEKAVSRMIDEVMAAYGRIDILVHAAGVGWSWGGKSPHSMDPTLTTPFDKWQEVININLNSCFLTNKAVLPHMLAQGGGAIVNIASVLAFTGINTGHTYCAAKGGVQNFTRALAATYAKDGVRTNCIAPGLIDTPMVASVIDAFTDESVANALCPMQRAGTPDEVAYGCLYLASDEASYCNGSTLVIDGGSTARPWP